MARDFQKAERIVAQHLYIYIYDDRSAAFKRRERGVGACICWLKPRLAECTCFRHVFFFPAYFIMSPGGTRRNGSDSLRWNSPGFCHEAYGILKAGDLWERQVP